MHYYVIEFIVESIRIPRMMGLYKIQRKMLKIKSFLDPILDQILVDPFRLTEPKGRACKQSRGLSNNQSD